MLWRDLTIEQQLNWLICLHVPWFRCDKADDWLLWGMGGICVLQAPSLDHRLSVASLFSYNISGYHKGNASRQQIPASHMNILILRIQTAAPYKNLDRRHNWTDSRRSDTWISLHLYFCSYPATTFNVLKTYRYDRLSRFLSIARVNIPIMMVHLSKKRSRAGLTSLSICHEDD